MKSYLIKDTTKEERIALIREWIPVDENLDGSDIDLWDMYDPYIKGEKDLDAAIADFKAAVAAQFPELVVE